MVCVRVLCLERYAGLQSGIPLLQIRAVPSHLPQEVKVRYLKFNANDLMTFYCMAFQL